MKIKVLKLGTFVKELVTGNEGVLTHMCVMIGGRIEYVFQPKGLNSSTGKPIESGFVQQEQISGGIFIEVDIPLFLLMEKAKDKNSGYSGRIVTLTYHINGCIHVCIKPKGINPATGNTFDALDFDLVS